MGPEARRQAPVAPPLPPEDVADAGELVADDLVVIEGPQGSAAAGNVVASMPMVAPGSGAMKRDAGRPHTLPL